jgi:hypothetical protein
VIDARRDGDDAGESWHFGGRASIGAGRMKVWCVAPGDSTPRYSDDVDFVQVGKTWYKISMWTFDVTADCGPDSGFSQATPAEQVDIAAKLKALGRNETRPCGK